MSPIRDPIHGYIEVTPHIDKLLDTRIVQRLRNVKQLGWTNLVYPGANHTRFEHSLGTYYLASRLGSELSDEERREIEIAALLHESAMARIRMTARRSSRSTSAGSTTTYCFYWRARRSPRSWMNTASSLRPYRTTSREKRRSAR